MMTGQLVRSVSSRLARTSVSKTKMEVGEEDIHINFCPHIHTCAHKHMHTPRTHTQNMRMEKGVGCVQGASFYLESTWDGMCPGMGLCKKWRTVSGGQERRPQRERSSRGRGGVCTCWVSGRDDFGSLFMFPSTLWKSRDGEACMKHHGGDVWRSHTEVQDVPGCSLCWTVWHKYLGTVLGF